MKLTKSQKYQLNAAKTEIGRLQKLADEVYDGLIKLEFGGKDDDCLFDYCYNNDMSLKHLEKYIFGGTK